GAVVPGAGVVAEVVGRGRPVATQARVRRVVVGGRAGAGHVVVGRVERAVAVREVGLVVRARIGAGRVKVVAARLRVVPVARPIGREVVRRVVPDRGGRRAVGGPVIGVPSPVSRRQRVVVGAVRVGVGRPAGRVGVVAIDRVVIVRVVEVIGR